MTADFATKYGPWALVVGASDGVGSLFAERLANEGANVVLVARRQHVLDGWPPGFRERTDAETRTLAVDLTDADASQTIIDATADLEVGMLVYCAGGDPNYQPFLANPVSAAEALLQRNCLVLMRLCHHFARPMVERGRGGIVNFTSGAALAGGRNMVTYGGTKAFDMVFTEGLWVELHDKGVDVLGLVLGMTDTRRCASWSSSADVSHRSTRSPRARSPPRAWWTKRSPTSATDRRSPRAMTSAWVWNSSNPCPATRWFS